MIKRRELISGLLASASLWQVSPGWAKAALAYTPDDHLSNDQGLTMHTAQASLLDALVDCIIPPTDTPGAVAAGVPACIRYILKYGEEKYRAQEFLQGLDDLDSRVRAELKQAFPTVSQARQVEFLTKLERRKKEPLGEFLAALKSLTVFAYCTSQLGATQTLRYLPMPGPYQGCINLTDEHRTWAS
jgi:gluconate 2-dehydrogenase gamma chain